MARYVWGDRAIGISQTELNRQYRVAKQTLAMHHTLRDRYRHRAVVAKCVLLAMSTVFCATTFGSDNVYRQLGLNETIARAFLSVGSILAFVASLTLLVLNWEGTGTQHADAAERWSRVVALFHEHWDDEGNWALPMAEELSRMYWEASSNSVSIPDRMFNALKAKYLMKLEMSQRISAHPGVPRFVLWLLIRFSGTARAIRQRSRLDTETHNEPKS